MKQGFRYSKLCETFKKFNRTHEDIFNKYEVSVKQHIHLSALVCAKGLV